MLYGYVAVYCEESVRGVTSYQSSTWIRKEMNRIATDFQARWKWQGSPKSWHTNLHRQKMTNMWRPVCLKDLFKPQIQIPNDQVKMGILDLLISPYISIYIYILPFQASKILTIPRIAPWSTPANVGPKDTTTWCCVHRSSVFSKEFQRQKITAWAILLEIGFTGIIWGGFPRVTT